MMEINDKNLNHNDCIKKSGKLIPTFELFDGQGTTK